jgi:L-fuculose-phosphate aldolase
VVGMEGNVSKIENDIITIKASGSSLKGLDKLELVDFHIDGNQLSNHDKKGSMEFSFHKYLYQNFDIKYIAHTHPTNLLKILVSEKVYKFANKRMFPDQVIFNGKKSCVIPYAKPGEPLMRMIQVYLEEFIKKEKFFPNTILLKNHGLITCGQTINECLYATEICEKSAEIFMGKYQPKFLSKNEINELINDEKEKYRKSLL